MPTCHNPAYCPAWGEYADKTARERQERVSRIRETEDYRTVRKMSGRWVREMRRRKELKER